MKFRIPLAIAALTVTGVLVGPASPASAQTANFQLTGGTLSVAVGGTATLSTATTKVGAQNITGTLGTVTVTDDRGGTANWTASGTSSTFTGTGLSTSTGVSYTSGTITKTGTSTVAGSTAQALTATAASIVTATAVSGNNTASWDPTLTVAMPAGALAGSYTGTITTSVA